MKHNICLKEFIKYSVLNMLGMTALSCYILADTFFVAGGMGADGLAALNLAIPVYSFIHGSGLMLGMGGATRYTILKSQGREKEGDRVFTCTLKMGVLLSAVFMGMGLSGSQVIARLLGAEGIVYEMCKTYLRVLMLFSPAFLLNEILICFVRNDGVPGLSMRAMAGGSFSNILMDYILIFPLDMGMFGAVFATGTSPLVSMALMSPHFLQKNHGFHFRKGKASLSESRFILAGGVPSLVTELSSGIVMIIFNSMLLGLQGNIGVAAYGVIANLSLVVIALYTGIAQGIQPLLSRYYGSGRKEEVQAVIRYAVITVILLSVLIYGLVFVQADSIAGAFNREGNVMLQEIAVSGMKYYFTGGLFAGINIVLAMYFTSRDCPGPAGAISILRGFVVIIPLIFLLSALWQMTGLWLTFPITELLVAVPGILWYLKERKSSA